MSRQKKSAVAVATDAQQWKQDFVIYVASILVVAMVLAYLIYQTVSPFIRSGFAAWSFSGDQKDTLLLLLFTLLVLGYLLEAIRSHMRER